MVLETCGAIWFLIKPEIICNKQSFHGDCFFVGKKRRLWAISVNGNWRITFEFENGKAYIVNYEDYH
ncbi:MAG: type II toxin-antitoxin system RelE/ParE family toxin [Fibrobacteria bacterium]|nr:type II toxin-antitoxin system RelE/ParE family toxin [Fibrobacteria bacterium]